MDFRPLIPLGWLLAGALSLGLTLAWLRRRDGEPHTARLRRGTAHGLLGLQEFVEPSVEFIFQAENAEQKEEDDASDAAGDTPERLQARLALALQSNPVDAEAVRLHLTAAEALGIDWRALFERVLRDELAARPFRAPVMPPAWKVAPRNRA